MRTALASDRWSGALAAAALVVGVALRLVGAAVNTAANDDHMDVIRAMAYERRVPAAGEFWESFQPPAYHLAVAGMLVAVSSAPSSRDVTVAQAMSCAAGLGTLMVLVWFIGRLGLSVWTRSVGVAFVSLNPALVSASVQATNDAFVIFFGTVALAAGYRFFRVPRMWSFLVMTASVLLACLSKGNGLAIAGAALLACGAAIVHPHGSRRMAVASGAILLVAIGAVVPTLGGYLARRTQLGSALAINQEPAPPPRFFEETFVKRPGITSVVHGFLTFRLFDMLRQPLVELPDDERNAQGYPRHRTSFWSLLYGGTHALQYPYYPEAWRVDRPLADWLVRAALVLGLLPGFVLVLGVTRGVVAAVRGLTGGANGATVVLPDALLAIAAVGAVAFLAAYGYRYRDFATTKAIFLCPSVLALVAWFCRELDCPGGVWHGKVLLPAARVSAVLLCLTYAVDGALLLRQLWAGS